MKREQRKLNLMDPLSAVRQDNFLPHQVMQAAQLLRRRRVRARSNAAAKACFAGVQNHDHPGHQERGQRNVLGDDEIAGFGVLGDVSVCHIGSAIHADGHDERVSRRRLEPLVCHEDGCHLEPLRRPEDQLLHVPRRGVRVYPDLQVCPPENEALRVLVVKLPKKRPRHTRFRGYPNTDERHGLLLDPRCSFGHAEFSNTVQRHT